MFLTPDLRVPWPEIREWRLLLLPEDGDSVVLPREKARELLERSERLEKERAELLPKFEEYRTRHPETVGVQFGKAYRLNPAEPRVSGGNHRAERALRPAVVARKISGGSRSGRGARVFAVLATVVQTLRLRSQDMIRDGLGVSRLGSGVGLLLGAPADRHGPSGA